MPKTIANSAMRITVANYLGMQDGPAAGQTVPHVHVHVLPRRAGDFKENDEVYGAIEANEADLERWASCLPRLWVVLAMFCCKYWMDGCFEICTCLNARASMVV